MQIVNLQIAPSGVSPVINLSQYDVGRQFQLVLYDGSTAYSLPAGTTARIDGVKPDKTAFSYTDGVSVSNNTVTITTQDQMTVLSGMVECELRFYKSGLNIGTLNFKLNVEKSPINEDTPVSETEIPAIIELATEQEQNAEAWAKGTKGGVPVTSGDPQYHNNAYYHSEQANTSATNASNSAISASSSASAASSSATQSESWAVGGTGARSGEDTNNSHYWAIQAMTATSDVAAYIAIIKLILGTVYLACENGDRLLTESGDNIIIDY